MKPEEQFVQFFASEKHWVQFESQGSNLSDSLLKKKPIPWIPHVACESFLIMNSPCLQEVQLSAVVWQVMQGGLQTRQEAPLRNVPLGQTDSQVLFMEVR